MSERGIPETRNNGFWAITGQSTVNISRKVTCFEKHLSRQIRQKIFSRAWNGQNHWKIERLESSKMRQANHGISPLRTTDKQSASLTSGSGARGGERCELPSPKVFSAFKTDPQKRSRLARLYCLQSDWNSIPATKVSSLLTSLTLPAENGCSRRCVLMKRWLQICVLNSSISIAIQLNEAHDKVEWVTTSRWA